MKETYQTGLTEKQEQSTDFNEKVSTPASLPQKSHPVWIALAIVSLYLIWGSTYLGMRLALESFPSFMMSGIRFLVAGGIMYLVLRIRGIVAPTRHQWLGSAGYLLRTVRPALATSYAYVNPMVAVILGAVWAGEHITIIGILAMFVILTGVGLVSLVRGEVRDGG